MTRHPDAMTMDDAGEELTRGHKKKARTRQLLVEAAMRIYEKKNAGELALNELASEAGVSHGTIYNYFRTKEEVLEAVGIAVADQISEQIAELSVGLKSGAERMSVAVRSFILRTAENTKRASALIRVVRYSETMQSKLSEYLRADLRIGLEQGEFNYASETIATRVVISVTISAMSSIVDGDMEENHDSKVAEMILLAMGLSRAKAKRIAFASMPNGWEIK